MEIICFFSQNPPHFSAERFPKEVPSISLTGDASTLAVSGLTDGALLAESVVPKTQTAAAPSAF